MTTLENSDSSVTMLSGLTPQALNQLYRTVMEALTKRLRECEQSASEVRNVQRGALSLSLSKDGVGFSELDAALSTETVAARAALATITIGAMALAVRGRAPQAAQAGALGEVGLTAYLTELWSQKSNSISEWQRATGLGPSDSSRAMAELRSYNRYYSENMANCADEFSRAKRSSAVVSFVNPRYLFENWW